jgi:hypothetical protein
MGIGKDDKLFAANHHLYKTYFFPVSELFNKLTFFFQGSNMAEHFLHISSRTDLKETEQLSTCFSNEATHVPHTFQSTEESSIKCR